MSDAQENFALRFPGLNFLLNFENDLATAGIDALSQGDLPNLERAEVIYLYGIGSGLILESFTSWLDQDSGRDLVVVEQDLCLIKAMVERGCSLFSRSQFHLKYLMDSQQLENFADECAATFPRAHVMIFNNQSNCYKNSFEEFKLLILKKTTVRESLKNESLYYSEIFRNLSTNFKLWPDSFFANSLKNQFKNCPAVICGAGPSLEDSIDELNMIKDRALIMAGGSALSALSHFGIEPHLGFAIDPNQQEFECLKPASTFEVPIFYGCRLYHKVSALFNHLSGYIQTASGGATEPWMERRCSLPDIPLDFGQISEAMSVTTMVIAYAVHLGCDPIYLCGIDLAYTQSKRYADGIKEDNEVDFSALKEEVKAYETIIEKFNSWGSPVITTVKWVMESNWISNFAKKQTNFHFFQTHPAGLGFKGISCSPLAGLANYCQRDLKGEVYSAALTAQIQVSEKQIERCFDELKDSLTTCQEHCLEILKALENKRESDDEPVLYTINHMDIQQQEAYQALFVNLEELLKEKHRRLLRKPLFTINPPKNEILYHVWQDFRKILQEYLDSFEKNTLQG